MHGVLFRGRRYDTGNKLDYLRTQIQFACDRPDIAPEFVPWLRRYLDSLCACRGAAVARGTGPGAAMTIAEHTGQAAMQSVDSYLAEVLAAIRPLPPRELGLDEADGAVLTEDVTAAWPLPPFDNSAMDGYAVLAADVAAATPEQPVTLPVRGEVAAGDTGRTSCARDLPQDHDRRAAAGRRGRGRAGRVDRRRHGRRAGHDQPARRARQRDPADRRRRGRGRRAADGGNAAGPGAARPARGGGPRHGHRPPPARGSP